MRHFCAFFLALVLFAGTAAAENLLENPSFEEPIGEEWEAFPGGTANSAGRTNLEAVDGTISYLIQNSNAQNGDYYAVFQRVFLEPGVYAYGGKMKSQLDEGFCHIDLYNAATSIRHRVNEGGLISGLHNVSGFLEGTLYAKLAQVTQTGPSASSSNFQATFELYDDSNSLLDTKTVSAGTNLNEVFGALSTDVYVSVIAVQVASGIGYAEYYMRPSNPLFPHTVDTNSLVLDTNSSGWVDFNATFTLNEGTDVDYLDFRILGDGEPNMQGHCYFDGLFLEDALQEEPVPPEEPSVTLSPSPMSGNAPLTVDFKLVCSEGREGSGANYCSIDFGSPSLLVSVDGREVNRRFAEGESAVHAFGGPLNGTKTILVRVRYDNPGIYDVKAQIRRGSDSSLVFDEDNLVVSVGTGVCEDSSGNERQEGETWTIDDLLCTCTANSTVECEPVPVQSELLLPRVSYNWNWSEINEDYCDSGEQFCDATQFTIYLLKNLNNVAENSFVPSENKSIIQGSTIEFNAFLMRDGFSDDFRKDFDYYYRTQPFFEVDDWYANLGSGSGMRAYFYNPQDLGKWEFRFNGEPWENGDTVGPGMVTVRLSVPSDFSLSNLGEEPVIVDFASAVPPENNSLFYRLPFNGEVGLSAPEGGTIDRVGYGVGYSGDGDVRLPLAAVLNDRIEFTSAFSNTDGVVQLRNVVVKDSFGGLNEFAKRGELIRVSRVSVPSSPFSSSSAQIFDLEFSPSVATPVLLEVNRNAADPVNFVVQYFVNMGESPLNVGAMNFVPWRSNTDSCVDFMGRVMNTQNYSQFLDDEVVFGPSQAYHGSVFEVVWPASTETGKLVLQSIVYSPSSGPVFSLGIFNQADALFHTPDDSGNIVFLDGSVVKTMGDVLGLLDNRHALAQGSVDKSTVSWNTGRLDSLIAGQRNFLRASCVVNPLQPGGAPGDDEMPEEEPEETPPQEEEPSEPPRGFLEGLFEAIRNVIDSVFRFFVEGLIRSLFGGFFGSTA